MKTITYVLIAVLLVSKIAAAQQQVHVMTKQIERRLDYDPGFKLHIAAEKATIDLTSWNKNYILIEVKLISKHKKKTIAQEELDFLKFEIHKKDKTYSLRNYFEADAGYVKVKGNLLTEYVIKVPDECKVIIDNQYGKLNISQRLDEFTAKLKFVECQILRGSGKFDIQSVYGDIFINGFSGNLTTNLNRSDLRLVNAEGSADLNAVYGELDIEEGDFKKLIVKADRTKINFSTSNPAQYNYAIDANFSSIKMPDQLGTDLLDTDQHQKFVKEFKSDNPRISITTSFGSINLIQLYNVSNE